MGTVTIEQAEESQAEQIAALVRRTVREVYPRYYLPEIVDAFCRLHSAPAVLEDIRRADVLLLRLDGELIGTGTRREEGITRVYVLPDFQGRGYGTLLMDTLERRIAGEYPAARLDASLPACQMYEHRGYRTVRHERWPVENGVVLVYEIMEKPLQGAVKGGFCGA